MDAVDIRVLDAGILFVDFALMRTSQEGGFLHCRLLLPSAACQVREPAPCSSPQLHSLTIRLQPSLNFEFRLLNLDMRPFLWRSITIGPA